MNKLTKIECDRQKLPGLYSDGKGLYLQVRPGKEGIRKSWVFRYTLPGKSPRTMGLGSFPDIGLADAREKALVCRKLLADGIDPKDHRDQARAADAINSITFKDATIRYIETFGPRWRKGAAENLMREQEKHVFPVLADMRLTDITTRHVLQAVRPKWDIIPNQMWECLGAIRRILEFTRARMAGPIRPNSTPPNGAAISSTCCRRRTTRLNNTDQRYRGSKSRSSSADTGKLPRHPGKDIAACG
jgi:Arm DNA-binding domain/Phage integrase central domain